MAAELADGWGEAVCAGEQGLAPSLWPGPLFCCWPFWLLQIGGFFNWLIALLEVHFLFNLKKKIYFYFLITCLGMFMYTSRGAHRGTRSLTDRLL